MTETETPPLSGKQRRHLRALAHHLDAIVQVGKEGLSDSVAAAVDHALLTHELVKVRVLESSPVDRKDAAGSLASLMHAQVADVIGRVIVLYRRHPTEPRIVLP